MSEMYKNVQKNRHTGMRTCNAELYYPTLPYRTLPYPTLPYTTPKDHKCVECKREVSDKFKDDHTWLSVATNAEVGYFDSTEKMTCLLTVQLMLFTITAILYGGQEEESLLIDVITAVWASIISAPVFMICSFFLKRSLPNTQNPTSKTQLPDNHYPIPNTQHPKPKHPKPKTQNPTANSQHLPNNCRSGPVNPTLMYLDGLDKIHEYHAASKVLLLPVY